jgi:hypothetical protein
MSEARLPVVGSTSAVLARLSSGTLALPFSRDILLLQCHVAGTAYRDIGGVDPQLESGEELALRREPDNPHDPRAIRVHRADGSHLGYLPRDRNEVIASLMDAGKLVVARVVDAKREDRWLRLTINVLFREP